MFVTLIIFLICWEAIYTYFPIHKKIKKIPEKCIHVLTYNIMHFGNSNEYLEVNHNPIIQYIVDQNPDIICLQEFKSKNQAQLSAIRNALRSTPYYFILPCGVALFSKYDILSAKKVPLESVSNGALIAELNINGEKVTILNCHLESNKISDSEKIEYFNLIKAPNIYKLKSFMYVMFSKLTPAFKMRAIQSIIISEIIKKNKNRYVIVCGDFNDTPISYTYHKIKGDLNDAFVENGCGMGISFDSNHFLFRIDYILHSNNMRSYNIMVGKLKDSDHYPVQTYLRFIHN
jgi:endonuclease/exonuclease/phosphatase family metal-dependent hydrolase